MPEALASGLVDAPATRRPPAAQAQRPGELTRAAEVIAVGRDARHLLPGCTFELMCARVRLGADVDGRGVHARLDRLERRLGMGDGP